jgi:hypothetical protein
MYQPGACGLLTSTEDSPEGPRLYGSFRGSDAENNGGIGHYTIGDAQDEVRAVYDSGFSIWDEPPRGEPNA